MRIRGHPTVETLAIIAVVFVCQQLVGVADWDGLFVLAPPVTARPWTAVTSVYAHLTVAHLVGNAVALAVVGPLVARRTSRLAFHAFFVATGALAAVAEVALGGLLWTPSPVLGASGAVFGLIGYLLAGNVVSRVVLDRLALSARTQFVGVVILAIGVTVLTAGARTALIGHAMGLACGLAAGRARLLDRPRAD